jgi:cobalamin 5'-phosphate synthase/cobalamin synthase
MFSLLLAFSFLTRYPVPLGSVELKASDFGHSTRYFPLAGLVVGLDLLLFRWVLGWAGILEHWPLAGAAMTLAYWVWTCDSLHLDGLADTADGMASRRTGEELLEVMHDSRSGAFGIQAIGVVLLLKFAFLASLPPKLWWALPLPLLFSRLLAALLCHDRPYAGRPGSLSAWFIEGNQPADASAAVGWACLSLGALCTAAVFTGLADVRDCGLALAACVGGMLIGWALVQAPRRRLGGISGDLIGYGLEVAEISSCYLLLFVLAHP